MIEDWVETAVNRGDFRATVHPKGRTEFELEGSDAAAMIALLLRRRREASGASLRDKWLCELPVSRRRVSGRKVAAAAFRRKNLDASANGL